MRFAAFTFDPSSGELRRNGEPVALEHQPSRVLAHLLASPGQLITRSELAAAVWGNETHVNFDDGLNYCVRQIRAALGDEARSPRFIETVPRRGYRFVGRIDTMTARPNRWRQAALAVGLVLTVLAGIAAESRPNNHHAIAVAAAKAIHDLIF